MENLLMSDYNPGDIIIVHVDGRPYETYITKHGIQRFRTDHTNKLWDRWKGDEDDRLGRGTEDLTQLVMAYLSGEFTEREYMEFNMSLGYSMCGFCELSSFQHLRVINPLWGDDLDSDPDDVYLYKNCYLKNITLEEVLQTKVRRDGITYEEAQAEFVDDNLVDL